MRCTHACLIKVKLGRVITSTHACLIEVKLVREGHY
jgi:hypothetical protein